MKTITIEQLLQLYPKQQLLNGAIKIIDVRTLEEYQHEHIEQAELVPLSQLSRLAQPSNAQHIAVFHCRSGNRTKIHEIELDNTPFKEKYCLAGGIEAWKQAGLPVKKSSKASIDIMRQVQIVASIMILLGVGLSYAVSPYWNLLAGFVGLGLFLAGTTGFCGMAILLKKMPWNRVCSNNNS